MTCELLGGLPYLTLCLFTVAVFAAGSSKILDFVLVFHWILSTAANSLDHAAILVLHKILVLVAGYILCLGSLQ